MTGKRRKPTGIDLFCGCGGFSLGMKQGGFDVRVAVDNSRLAAQTYRWNHPDTAFLEEDIRDVTGEMLLAAAGLEKGELDILFGGPPCQGFSLMNKNHGLDDPRSKLMAEFVRLVGEVAPRRFLIENIPDMLRHKDFVVLLMETLEARGYVVRLLLMNAASYGVPQRRRRVLIQGVRSDIGLLPVFPAPTHFEPEALKTEEGGWLSRGAVAQECFAPNGFPKEDVPDLWWNTRLSIQMNKKTAAAVVAAAVNYLIADAIKNAIPTRPPRGPAAVAP